MNFIFELSKEYHKLPTNEIISCLKSENIKYKIIKSNHDLLIISALKQNVIKKISKRINFILS